MLFFAKRQGFCFYNFFSIAGSRHSYSYSKACYSYSRNRSLHSRCYSHYRRKGHPKSKQPIFLLKVISCTRSPHSYFTREGVKLPNLSKNVLYFLRIGKELARVRIAVFFVEFDFHKEPVISEFRFNFVQVINYPKG